MSPHSIACVELICKRLFCVVSVAITGDPAAPFRQLLRNSCADLHSSYEVFAYALRSFSRIFGVTIWMAMTTRRITPLIALLIRESIFRATMILSITV